jgi:hypothetical protein
MTDIFREMRIGHDHWILGVLVFVFLVCNLSSPATAEETTGLFKEFGSEFGLGFLGSGGTGGGTQAELFISLRSVRFQNLKYSSWGLEYAYRGSDTQDLNHLIVRYDWGLKDVSMRDKGGRVQARVTYLSAMAGYGWGEVWDNVYLPIYGTNEDVAVGVSGFPLYLALGYRRYGGLGWGVEAIGGLFLVTGSDPDEEEAEASSVIPSLGIRIYAAYDSFQKVFR